MKKTLAVLATIATVGAATLAPAPAEAHRFGIGPGLAFGLAAGAITAGALGAYGYYGPYGYAPYYGPAYYGPAYGYYRPYWRRHYVYRYW
jgi:hypothetical protein